MFECWVRFRELGKGLDQLRTHHAGLHPVRFGNDIQRPADVLSRIAAYETGQGPWRLHLPWSGIRAHRIARYFNVAIIQNFLDAHCRLFTGGDSGMEGSQ
jgi:hypothetical protein